MVMSSIMRPDTCAQHAENFRVSIHVHLRKSDMSDLTETLATHEELYQPHLFLQCICIP